MQTYAFDADGCLYNRKYFGLLFFIFDKYWDVFLQAKKNPGVVNKAQIQAILRDISEHQFIADKSIDLKKLQPDFLQLFNRELARHQGQFALGMGSTFAEILPWMNQVDPAILPAILCKANASLFDFINADAVNDFYLASISNRQSYKLDATGVKRNGTGSIFFDLIHMQTRFQSSFSRSCKVLKFCMADVYGNLARGESFDHVLNSLSQDQHADTVYDEHKFSVAYGLIHDIYQELSQTENEANVLTIFDDRLDILSLLNEVFSTYPNLLPKNMTLRLCSYSGEEVVPIASIVGKGPVDKNYANNIQLLNTLFLNSSQSDYVMDANDLSIIENFMEARTIEIDKIQSHPSAFFQLPPANVEKNLTTRVSFFPS